MSRPEPRKIGQPCSRRATFSGRLLYHISAPGRLRINGVNRMEGKSADQIRTLKIIFAAMTGGVLAFSVVAVVLITSGSTSPNDKLGQTLLMVLGLIVGGEIPAYVFIRLSVVNKLRTLWQSDSSHVDLAARVHGGFMTLTILGAAMIEGVGLFGALIYLTTANAFGLVASGVTIVLLLILFPTQDKAQRFKANITGQSV